MTAPDSIDPKNPPAGSFKSPAKTVDGHDVILYNGGSGNVYEAYDATTGQKIDKATGVDNLVGDLGQVNLLKIFGVSDADAHAVLVRGGLIVLGAALGIAGLAMIISGTKAAGIIASVTPVGKVLK